MNTPTSIDAADRAAIAPVGSASAEIASAEIAPAGVAPHRRRRWRPFAVAALALAAGFWLGWPSRRGPSAGQELVIANDALRLGDVWVQQDFRWTLPLRNVGQRELEIVHFGCSPCGCCRFEPSEVAIPPGEQRDVQVFLDLRPRNDKDAQLAERDYQVNITLSLRDEIGPPRMWPLAGKIRSAVALSPRRLDFANTPVQGLAAAARTVTIRPHAPLADLKIEWDSDRLMAHLEREEASGQYRLTVQPQGDLPEGPFEATILLKPALLKPVLSLPMSGRSDPPPTAYQVVGEVQADVHALPATVSFGPRELGVTADHLVTLRSHSGKPFEVRAIQATSPDVRVVAIETAGEAAQRLSHQFQIQPTFGRRGRFSAEVEFSFRLADKPGKVVVPVLAHVAGPE